MKRPGGKTRGGSWNQKPAPFERPRIVVSGEAAGPRQATLESYDRQLADVRAGDRVRPAGWPEGWWLAEQVTHQILGDVRVIVKWATVCPLTGGTRTTHLPDHKCRILAA